MTATHTDYLIAGHFTTMELVSHIGESESTRSFLNEVPVLRRLADGTTERTMIFQYNGNAWRGQLRDNAAEYMREHLDIDGMELRAFNMLYSGGAFTEGTSVPVAKIRTMRTIVPMLAVFSSGETRDSKMAVNAVTPVCEEASGILSHTDASLWHGVSYRDLRTEINLTRRDDAKDPQKNIAIRDSELMLDGDGGKPAKKGVSTQMRTTFEAIVKGAMLETTIRLFDASEIELGCLVSALDRFGRKPKIGGKVNAGFGEVALTYDITDMRTGETRPFVRVGNGVTDLAPEARAALTAYTTHLQSVYDESLTQSSGSIRALLSGAA